MPFPAWSLAAVLIVTVYFVLSWRLVEGVQVIVAPFHIQEQVTEGEDETAPCVADWFIPSLQMTLTFALRGTLVAPFAGLVLTR
jgi:hypothetical protein